MLICSFVHLNFYVYIYSLFTFVQYQLKILPLQVMIPWIELNMTVELYRAADPALDLDATPADTAPY